MRFIKCIFGKINHFIKNLICCFFRNSSMDAPFYAFFLITVNKVLTFPCHDITLFFGHCPAHKIASSKRVSGKAHYNLHNLFLINDTAVSRCKDFFQFRTGILNRILILLSLDILWNKIHRTRTIQRNTGNYIFQICRF